MREITVKELQKMKSDNKKILVDFKARWCGPCKTLLPRLDKLSESYPNVEFVAVDVDDNMEQCLELGIRGVPTVMIFNGEELIDRSQGMNVDLYYKNFLDNL
jgi:thioredoxin 1